VRIVERSYRNGNTAGTDGREQLLLSTCAFRDDIVSLFGGVWKDIGFTTSGVQDGELMEVFGAVFGCCVKKSRVGL
jgi:hypothetical protein